MGVGAKGAGGPVRGSLRWLEQAMRARGANPVSVRNIIYRDIGTAADKEALGGILAELAAEAGLSLTPEDRPSQPPPLPDELELLGRSKKRAYKQFLAGVRSGRTPRLIVTGKAGAGKTVLLDHLARALKSDGVPLTRVALSGDAAQILGVKPAQGSSFAAQAQVQLDAARAALPGSGALLVRVTDDLTFRGQPPRNSDGTPISAALWANTQLLERAPAGVAVLLAVESARELGAVKAEVIELKPPTPAEARTYLMARLGVNRAEADRLVRETGRHLDRLTLLVNLSSGENSPSDLLADPETRRLVQVTAALQAASIHTPGQAWPTELLNLALGQVPRQLPAHARALLGGSDALGWRPIPVLRSAWAAVESAAKQDTLRLLSGVAEVELRPYQLAALAELRDWEALAAAVSAQPDDARHLPALWPAIRAGAAGRDLETLARAVISHHAGRGEYNESRARDALFTLLESPRDEVRAWARVKLAESSLEAGNMEAARTQLEHADVTGMRGANPWTAAAQADALLVQAALARWQGDLVAATQAATDPRTVTGGPRALLWRGLIAKDAGRWPEALSALQDVPRSSPLLSARARYQEGDLRLRLGQPLAALDALQDAVTRLEAAGGSAEERSRVLARTSTALRRLGRPAEALDLMGQALALVPSDSRRHVDGVPRARLLSESVPILLALGRPDDALARAVTALNLLGRTEIRAAEAHYRTRRTHYRVALAYLTRGLGKAYLQPFAGPQADHPDLRQARALLDSLMNEAPTGSDRDQILLFDMHLSRALAEPDAAAALEGVTRALDMTEHAYEEAQARAMRAEALLRAGRAGDALADINRAHALLRRVQTGLSGTHATDPGLYAQLLILEYAATLQDGPKAVRWLRESLSDPALAPFRAGVWREAGLALEAHPQAKTWLKELHPQAMTAHLRVSDALRLCEQTADPN